METVQVYWYFCYWDLLWRVCLIGLPPFHFPNLGRGSWGGAPVDGVQGITPWKLLEFYMWFGAFRNRAIWWQLFVGHRTRYICNLAIKTEPICQLRCPRDCTVVLLLHSSEHALTQLHTFTLKFRTFGIPGLVLLGRGTAWHNPGHPGKSGTGGNPSAWVSSSCFVVLLALLLKRTCTRSARQQWKVNLLSRACQFLRHFFKYADHDNTKYAEITELYILWSELSRHKLSPRLASAHYSCPDNAVELVGRQLEAVGRKFSYYYQCYVDHTLCTIFINWTLVQIETRRMFIIAVENSNSCGKNAHFAEVCRIMRQ